MVIWRNSANIMRNNGKDVNLLILKVTYLLLLVKPYHLLKMMQNSEGYLSALSLFGKAWNGRPKSITNYFQ